MATAPPKLARMKTQSSMEPSWFPPEFYKAAALLNGILKHACTEKSEIR
jgi:hypothetical protein